MDAAERPGRARLHETERELGLSFQALVKEAATRRNGRRREQGERLRTKAELTATGCENPVRVRDAPGRRDATARRHLEVPGVDAICTVNDAEARVGDERTMDVRAAIPPGDC